MTKIVPVILSGGSGTRLWPLSREKTPKQFLKLMDGTTLLQKTARRTLSILENKDAEIIVVTLQGMHEETARQLGQISPVLTRHILLEPEARNTAAAVALAIDYAGRVFGEDVLLWLLPADHHIGNEAALRDALLKACPLALGNYLVTFGIEPTRPETGYGYIRKGESLNGTGSFKVEKFIEKPDHDAAVRLLESGNHLWSSGMHLLRADAGRDNFMRHAPEAWALVRQAVDKPSSHHRPSKALYAQVKKEPFETAVIEKAEKLAVVPCNPQWSDIGCWESLWEIKPKDSNGNTLSGNAFYQDTKDSMIMSEHRLVTCVGLKDVIIIETRDSVLVADKKCNGSLKTLVQNLQAKKREETIYNSTTAYEWGYEHVFADASDTKICEMTVNPACTAEGEIEGLSAQVVVKSGAVELVTNGRKMRLGRNETFTLGGGSLYSLHNPGRESARIYLLHFTQSSLETQERTAPLTWISDQPKTDPHIAM